MRFVKAFIWLVFVTVPTIGLLIALSYFDLPIGEGNPLENVSYHLLNQNPNSPMYTNMDFRYSSAQKFIQFGVYKLLIFLLIFWIIISVCWIVVSEFLKIDRPGKAIKFTWLWIAFFIIAALLPGAMSWYFLYMQEAIWHFAEPSRIIYLTIFLIIYSGIYFYINSIFITSRVLRPAVPLLTLILRN